MRCARRFFRDLTLLQELNLSKCRVTSLPANLLQLLRHVVAGQHPPAPPEHKEHCSVGRSELLEDPEAGSVSCPGSSDM